MPVLQGPFIFVLLRPLFELILALDIHLPIFVFLLRRFALLVFYFCDVPIFSWRLK